MRSVAIVVAMILLLIVVDLLLWIAAPERRLVRSAVLAGLAFGRVASGAAW